MKNENNEHILLMLVDLIEIRFFFIVDLYQIDFPEVMQRKLALIEVRSRLNEQFEPIHTYSSLENFGNSIK
jgi:hypothetical protein